MKSLVPLLLLTVTYVNAFLHYHGTTRIKPRETSKILSLSYRQFRASSDSHSGQDSNRSVSVSKQSIKKTVRVDLKGFNDQKDLLDSSILDLPLCRKPKQKRRRPKQTRRPSQFWADIDNIESELRFFWSSVNVPIDEDNPPPIPNEALLNHFERHDLRYAIANMGGRIYVAEKLGGARLIPGKWFEAVASSKEVQCLLKSKNPAGAGLSKNVPPIALHVKRSLAKAVKKQKEKTTISETDDDDAPREKYLEGRQTDQDQDQLDNFELDMDEEKIHTLRYSAGERWAHRRSRKPRGYWDESVVIRELYDHLSCVKEKIQRPSVWMARPSEMSNDGRDDLKQAITRYGGADRICDVAKLVPYKEWRYFESSFELFVELQNYLAIHNGGAEDVFPRLSDIQNNGHERLYDLVMEFGGRKMIATRLDMEYQTQTKLELFKGLSFGRFSLSFTVHLMHFIRAEMLEQEPPMDTPKIRMPTVKQLIRKGESDLAKNVIKYGGHESIARRLSLGFDQRESQKDAHSYEDKDGYDGKGT